MLDLKKRTCQINPRIEDGGAEENADDINLPLSRATFSQYSRSFVLMMKSKAIRTTIHDQNPARMAQGTSCLGRLSRT
jgi:hypothetical protein